ncbi:hypothetical protein HKW95_16920 [Pseudomonas chlororaphis subsp. aurantiaca]|nr:hypothetical protein FD951_14125 [Pseudomonas chlororaphis subsp. aurantiaca]
MKASDGVGFDVGAVYCISLKERADRRELFRHSIQRLISNLVVFHVVERNADPVRGCYESHQDLARISLERGLDRVLIFKWDKHRISPIKNLWRTVLRLNF